MQSVVCYLQMGYYLMSGGYFVMCKWELPTEERLHIEPQKLNFLPIVLLHIIYVCASM